MRERKFKLCLTKQLLNMFKLRCEWGLNIFVALNLTFIRGHKAFPVFHAGRAIIGLPCSQGQLSRIWKLQSDWLSLGKEYCSWLSRHSRGGMKDEVH